MKIQICTIGKQIKPWVQTGIDSYLKRITPPHQVVVRPLPAFRHTDIDIIKKKESDILINATSPEAKTIALDEKGTILTSESFTKLLEDSSIESKKICFYIGGAFGLDDSIRQKSSSIISLSGMTLPHAIARLMLIEQIYRSICIMSNHPYHK